ncbi:hypothetical protein HDU67_010143 [Dinochytrium kinnereticum]|nr:hypothetical protein HDU67_010143 [Dinochytrium kinnereticum]
MNGKSEHAIRTVSTKVRAMLLIALPLLRSYWPYAVRHAAHLANRSLSAKISTTPYEDFFHAPQTPKPSHLGIENDGQRFPRAPIDNTYQVIGKPYHDTSVSFNETFVQEYAPTNQAPIPDFAPFVNFEELNLDTDEASDDGNEKVI